MNDTHYGPRTGEGSWLWIAKTISGLLIIVILGLHFIVNHYASPTGMLSYADVVRYYQNPIIPIMEIGFVIFVVSHALLGLRGIVLDLNPSRAVVRGMNWLFTGVGAAAIVYGAWLILSIASRGI